MSVCCSLIGVHVKTLCLSHVRLCLYVGMWLHEVHWCILGHIPLSLPFTCCEWVGASLVTD